MTGGVGSGKSTAESFCAELNIPTADADRWAHDIINNDNAVKKKIVSYFIKSYNICPLLKSGELDRKVIASVAFENPESLKFLENLIHPAVKKKAALWIRQTRVSNVPAAVLIVPLLLESGMKKLVDTVISITASPEIRRHRLKTGRNWTDAEITARMDKQLNETERVKQADYIVDNNSTVEQFKQNFCLTLDAIKSKKNKS
ncbi:MAG: dephospho-CoA kinase [Victivallaceae bacterium]|nr:dephospho-CoA kinase [Victivallaceae bacterium]